MRKLLLENVSSVSEGSQVTLTWLTAQELDKIRIIRKKKIENLLSHLFILNIKILWKVQTRLGVTSCCPGGTSSSSVGLLILSWRTGRALLAGSGLNFGTSGSKTS